jgi:hypothetical protein
MIPPQMSEWEQNRQSYVVQLRSLAIGTMATILFSTWCLGATVMGGATALGGQNGSVQTDRPVSQALPGQQATDSKEVSGSTAGEAEAQATKTQPTQQNPVQTEIDKAKKNSGGSDEQKGEWLIAPIPINSPAIGAGLEWAVGRLFPINKKDSISPKSAVGAGGIFTNNGSRAIALGGRVYLKEDKYRIATVFGTATINADIYGVGKLAGDRGIYIPLKFEGGGFLGEFLYGLKKGVFIGAKGQYRNITMSLNQEKLDSSDITFQPPEQIAEVIDEIRNQLLSQQTVSIGPRFEWDSRDSVYYPKHGLFMDFWVDFFAEGLGSKWTYQHYKVAFNKYNKLGGTGVFAFRGMACAAAGDSIPLYDLCLFGSMNDIRGYAAGRFQDRRMFATQAEYRLMLPVKGFMSRFGVVGFFGFGGVGRTFSDIGWSDLLPGGGAGLRFRMSKKTPINYRIDYAFGKVGNTLTIGIGEAF